MKKILLVVACALLSTCTPHKTVTITANSITLKYDCSHFEPQAKSFEETSAIMEKSIEVMERSLDKDQALYRSLKAARALKDIRRLEELIVQDECAQQK